ncbi:MAG: deoxyribonucleoside 5'-monophosphate N-glycosidase [Chloroflexi bacterium]|nr:deoxyribonucleoside 5'-monophosphate N-glycosidase [Chloroflexota bacterium]
MNIYFACSITGGREYETVYQEITHALLEDGHEIPTAHLAEAGVVDLEKVVSPRDVYLRDVDWIRACDALIAEVSIPSHGVGYEIGFALNLGKPVLCLYQEGRPVSKMITGNPHSSLRVQPYQDPQGAVLSARDFVNKVTNNL